LYLTNSGSSRNSDKPKVYSRESKPFGRSWEDWSAIWWQWCSTEPEESNPVADKTGEFCNKNQHDPDVWFLAGTFGGKAERTCTIPFRKAILFPIINDLISYAEYNHLKTESDLRSYAKSDLDEATVYKATVDGVELQNLQKYRVQSHLFSFIILPDDPAGVPAGTTVGISDGYWVFLKPLSIGQHIIHFTGEKLKFDEIQHSNYTAEKPKFQVEVKYHVTII
jgi:hypothetical protein